MHKTIGYWIWFSLKKYKITKTYGFLVKEHFYSSATSVIHREPSIILCIFHKDKLIWKMVRIYPSRREGGGERGNLGSPLPREATPYSISFDMCYRAKLRGRAGAEPRYSLSFKLIYPHQYHINTVSLQNELARTTITPWTTPKKMRKRYSTSSRNN
jgi:hypothetical protein